MAGRRWSECATAVHCRSTITKCICCAVMPIPPMRFGTSRSRAALWGCALSPGAILSSERKPGQLVSSPAPTRAGGECDTGIAYIVGRRGNDGTDGWGAGNHIFVFDLSDPANPVFLRDWALDGQQPGGVLPPHFTAVPSIHGPVSTGPEGGDFELAGATGNRVYFAYGTGSNGVMQIVDRIALLPPPWGSGATCGSIASTLTSPACTDFHTAELGKLIMDPDNGAHTSWPLGKIIVRDFVTDTGNDDDNTVRDIVVVASEATAHFCSEFRH